VPVKAAEITPEEILICETQARMLVQVEPQHVDEVLAAVKAQNGIAAVIGEITDRDYSVFEYKGQIIATIPNQPSEQQMAELMA
jgi:phosphoribosylformylglycinamidine synthase